jgi:hypothetical protein
VAEVTAAEVAERKEVNEVAQDDMMTLDLFPLRP